METCKQFILRKDKRWREELSDPIFKGISMKDIGRQGRHFFKREAWTFMPQWNHNEKVFVVERLKKIKTEGTTAHKKGAKIGAIEYRIGYYMLGKIGRMKGKWTWGQYCPLIPRQDLEKLFSKAKQEKTILK